MKKLTIYKVPIIWPILGFGIGLANAYFIDIVSQCNLSASLYLALGTITSLIAFWVVKSISSALDKLKLSVLNYMKDLSQGILTESGTQHELEPTIAHAVVLM